MARAADEDASSVLRDSDGNYYVVPHGILDECRIPSDRTAALEEQIAAVTSNEVQGFTADSFGISRLL